MPVATRVSVSEYLSTSYRPDCDYVDGEVVERNVGEREHSRPQALIVSSLVGQEKQWGVTVLPEQRVQVRPDRYRVPDVCVLAAGAPREQIVTHPPFLCIEILSREDSMSRMLEKIEDYFAMGVPHVWVIDPWRRHGYHYTHDGMQDVKDGILLTSNPDLVVALAALFE